VFVCAANPLWADKKPLPEPEEDAISPGVTDEFLLDYRLAQGVA
jgi:hypothetical protein